jgi:predicted nucleic acid-binding protein
VVDASVAVKWVLPEVHSELADLLLGEERELWAPDLIWAEVGSIIWKRWRRGEIPLDTAQFILQAFPGFDFQVYPSEMLVDTAWEIAHTFERSFYDSLYLALAVHQECPMVTADRRLYNALRGASSNLPILWIEELR